MSLATRVARLEAQHDHGAFFVVEGYTNEEHQAGIAELIDSKVATANSLFVCIQKFGDRNAASKTS